PDRLIGSVAEVPAVARFVTVQHVLGDQDLVYLVGPVGDAQRAGRLVHAGEGKVVRDTGGAPHLDRPVDDPVVGLGHEDLDRGDVGPGVHVVTVDLLGRVD